MKRTEGWRGNSTKNIPQWKLQARKHQSTQRNRNFSGGGLPRTAPPAKITLPTIKFQAKEQP